MQAQDLLQGFLYEQDFFGAFLLVTIVLGGGAALIAGRSIALTWRPWWHVAFYMLILGGAERFIHGTLFDGTLLSAYYYAVDSLIAIAFGLAGFRLARARQMARQYAVVLGPQSGSGTSACGQSRP